MPNWTPAALHAQFLHCQQAGWIPLFEEVAQQSGFAPSFLLGLGSRETNLQNIRGDLRGGVYHGYGILQVDVETDPGWCAGWAPADVGASITRGVRVLKDMRDRLTAKGVSDPVALAAAYNTGAGNVLRSLKAGLSPDLTTTGKDYGADVVARAKVFETLLTIPASPAVNT